jgi:hypothetical protein
MLEVSPAAIKKWIQQGKLAAFRTPRRPDARPQHAGHGRLRGLSPDQARSVIRDTKVVVMTAQALAAEPRPWRRAPTGSCPSRSRSPPCAVSWPACSARGAERAAAVNCEPDREVVLDGYRMVQYEGTQLFSIISGAMVL